MSVSPIHRNACEISAAAEAVDALLLGAETMFQNFRQMMVDENVGTFWTDNELSDGIMVLLTLARHQAADIGKAGDTIQIASLHDHQARTEVVAS